MNFKGIFESSFHEFFPLNFLSILGRKLFGGTGEKTLRPYCLFSFLPPNQTHSKKVFLRILSPMFFILCISPRVVQINPPYPPEPDPEPPDPTALIVGLRS